MLFRYLSPWDFGEHSKSIAERAFKVLSNAANLMVQLQCNSRNIMQLMDMKDSHQMNFHSFVLLFGLMSKATLQERLKLLYILHLNRLLNPNSTSECSLDASTGESSKDRSMASSVHWSYIYVHCFCAHADLDFKKSDQPAEKKVDVETESTRSLPQKTSVSDDSSSGT